MKRHLTFVAVRRSEIVDRVLRPLIRFSQKHPVAIALVNMLAELLEECMSLRQILTGRAVTFIKIRHRIEPEPVNTHIEPEVEHAQQRTMHTRIVEVQVRLM